MGVTVLEARVRGVLPDTRGRSQSGVAETSDRYWRSSGVSRSRFLLGSVVVWALFQISIASASAGKWNLNDVSVLFDLPQEAGDPDVGRIRPGDLGGKGVMLPGDAYALLPTLYQPGRGNRSLYEQSLRVTAMRVDPCPASAQAGCRPELRLVWQPVEHDRHAGRWLSRDAAVHCIHAMREDEFTQLIRGLWRLKGEFAVRGVDTRRRALGVHPAASDPRTARYFAQAMKALILRHAGAENLRRVTFSALRVPTRWWRFGALEKDSQGE